MMWDLAVYIENFDTLTFCVPCPLLLKQFQEHKLPWNNVNSTYSMNTLGHNCI